ncbi:pimeloyl-ACP methyl ester carboxylesterase [Kineococcus radiotolerans]|uniref:Pimeloyl-ACP methyl ester carboxylesterase n=1 Tax=Kineococcus radiotolerans TaxID=131568 RepID=A0A7W4TQK5_KINRA|nr:alpha/beta hydrolase [Kineococcus radiotolerans]MBB2903219.1 pimeloyl-ACP methyl ester carboxylesterase [Kineococcus radiotolerans]
MTTTAPDQASSESDQGNSAGGAATALNRFVEVAGDTFAYRRFGTPSVTLPPLLMLQHFRGNLDFWDPVLLDILAVDREVITVDQRGVGASTGITRDNVTDTATDTAAFAAALGLKRLDVLGFSLGGHVAQDLTLRYPRLVRRLVLGGTAPQGAPNLHPWNDDVYAWATGDVTAAEDFIALFFTGSADSTRLAWEYLARTSVRQQDRDEPTSLATRDAQYTALMAWGIPDSSKLERLSAIRQPTLVANGDNDTMMITQNSYLLAERIPGAQLRIYPDSGHGFLDQHPQLFGEHVRAFLGH